MPYNTRRKSLSLPSLGIQLPNASRAHRSASKPIPSIDHANTQPPSKKVKRSHGEREPPSPISSPRSKRSSPDSDILDVRPKPRRLTAENTPPPSPGDVVPAPKIDTEGINDDIVIAVIEQLERTGNRPHLIRELAAVLASTNESVAQYGSPIPPPPAGKSVADRPNSSANPAALLSSRLSLYLKRPWTALSPSPLAKELIPVHPRKVFFFLTTQPRRPLAENSDDILSPTANEIKRLTPTASDPSVVDDDGDLDLQERSRLSPSPEVDLYSPELHEDLPMGPPTPGESFSGRSSINPDGTTEPRHRPTRAPSPSLEADEQGFTETATAVRARGMSLHDPSVYLSVETSEEQVDMVEPVDETPEIGQRRDQELGFELFGHAQPSLHAPSHKLFASSPVIHPRTDPVSSQTMARLPLSMRADDVDMDDVWNVPNPETIGVDELDQLFSDF